MPFTPPASPMFLLGEIFDGHHQQDDPESVLLLTPHAGGGIDPPPLWVIYGVSAFDRACTAVWGRAECAVVFLVRAGPAPDADVIPVPEVVIFDNGIDPPPLWVVHGVSAFYMACTAVWGRAECAIVLLVRAGPAPDADAIPVVEVVMVDNVQHDPHVAVTSLQEGGALVHGTVIVY